MKVSVLVAAAMVITSANAGGNEEATGWFVKTGSMVKTALTRSLSLSDLTTSLHFGSDRQGSFRGPSTSGGSGRRGSVSGSGRRGSISGPSRRGSISGPSRRGSVSGPSTSGDSGSSGGPGGEDAKPDPVCAFIVTQLFKLQKTFTRLAHKFEYQMKDFKALKDGMKELNPEELRGHYESRSKVCTKLQGVETSEDLKLLNYKADYESDMDVPDGQEDDDNDANIFDKQ
ncbi:hypothetical protein BASA61_002341 [Batrachochytrium salamandrivorans]|nr:hypothetical protein BASA60_009676 [Batrachochytrium salamandrivorans]KAH6600161.1 hypothetical protein BASA61_002341 [Batrachochytrium salamandrivorans]